MSSIRTRIAPSPTGNLHIGTARTALFNYLFAKKHGGVFVLRIEDTDLERSDPKYEKDILDSLRWLGIDADESPEVGGPYAPYRQSDRTESYKNYIQQLLSQGQAFYCFHSQKELEEEKQKLLEKKLPPLHFCEYREMEAREAETLAQTKTDHVIRFKTPAGRKITFTDIIRGELVFESDLIGDFSVARKMDSALYHLAVVVDDAETKISHIIRGEDHIANTPKHILLNEALGFPQPLYAHLPLILGPDRSKLSKRHGVTSITEYREQGYLPETLINFMALLGWNPGTDQEVFALNELAQVFDIAKVQKSGAVFNIEKLDWLSGEYIRKKTQEELTKLCLPYLCDFLQFKIPNDQFQNEYVEKVVALEQPRLKKLSEIGEKTEYFFRMPKYDKELLRWKNITETEILTSLEFSEKVIKSKIQNPKSKIEIEKIFLEAIGEGDKGSILWPLRVVLTGKKASPGPFDIIEILGAEETLKRLERAKKIL
ncbi:MAG: glutamate--tRNA ligase [Candidatus Sungbacteria bacterium]|nr:glutamate--tRNA ligase [Candidatus Sungbacteria bacterium]